VLGHALGVFLGFSITFMEVIKRERSLIYNNEMVVPGGFYDNLPGCIYNFKVIR
jgi:hypothetical protein